MKSRRCPWCDSWEPEHTVRCWWVQARRSFDPWGKKTKEPNW